MPSSSRGCAEVLRAALKILHIPRASMPGKRGNVRGGNSARRRAVEPAASSTSSRPQKGVPGTTSKSRASPSAVPNAIPLIPPSLNSLPIDAATSGANLLPPPSWFRWALEEPFQSLKISVVDEKPREVHVLRWGASLRKPGLLLVHGGGASAVWYRFIAPFFSNTFDVVAVSSSGCGDSDRLDAYHPVEDWGAELLGVCDRVGFFNHERMEKPVIVAHSMGTFITLGMLTKLSQSWKRGPTLSSDGTTMAPPESRFGGVILVDGAIRELVLSERIHKRVLERRKEDPTLRHRDGWKVQPPSVTPFSRYRLLPPQEVEPQNLHILKFIADASSINVPGGWEWRGDPNRDLKLVWKDMPLLNEVTIRQLAEILPIAWMYGEESLLCDTSSVNFVKHNLADVVGIVGIPCAQHHVFIDQPLSFVSGVRGILGGWNFGAIEEDEHHEGTIERTAGYQSKL